MPGCSCKSISRATTAFRKEIWNNLTLDGPNLEVVHETFVVPKHLKAFCEGGKFTGMWVFNCTKNQLIWSSRSSEWRCSLASRSSSIFSRGSVHHLAENRDGRDTDDQISPMLVINWRKRSFDQAWPLKTTQNLLYSWLNKKKHTGQSFPIPPVAIQHLKLPVVFVAARLPRVEAQQKIRK